MEYLVTEDVGVAQVCLELELSSPVDGPIMANISASNSSALGKLASEALDKIILRGITSNEEANTKD